MSSASGGLQFAYPWTSTCRPHINCEQHPEEVGICFSLFILSLIKVPIRLGWLLYNKYWLLEAQSGHPSHATRQLPSEIGSFQWPRSFEDFFCLSAFIHSSSFHPTTTTIYQLAFCTPGKLPARACIRKLYYHETPVSTFTFDCILALPPFLLFPKPKGNTRERR